MLLTLSDIELAQDMLKKQNEADKNKKKKAAEVCVIIRIFFKLVNLFPQKSEEEDHPLDKNYEMLNCKLEMVKAGSADYKLIEKYFENTNKGSWWTSAKKIINIWKMDRKDEVILILDHL